ncbi:MAG: SPOR domain-containing protein [Minwuiales bacterium]|nr:SPOR domain-containing protein [Minwuiales bacterium]
MTSKKAASLSSALLARKGSAVPAGLSESEAPESEAPAAGTPLPGLLKADIEQKNGNGNGHFHPISLERRRKAAPAARLGCDDPLQPPLLPGLTLQTGPTFKADKAETAEAAPAPAAPEKPATAPEQPAPTPQPASAAPSEKTEKTETPVKAAPPLRPKTPAPSPSAASKKQDYPEAPKPRATPTQSTAGQTLVAERRARPETSPTAARLAAAVADKTGEPMPMPAIAAIATVVVLALAGAGYLFFSDKGATTDVVAGPPATETATTLAAAAPLAAEPAETAPAAEALPPIPDQTALTVAASGGDESLAQPAPRPGTAIEPVTHLAAAGSAAASAVATAAVETAEPAGTGSAAAADEGPRPAPPRPTADTSNIVPTAAGSAPLPAPKPERLAALSNAAGGNGGGRFAVQLASVPSAAAAEREIRRLKRAYPTLFGSMAIDVQRSRGSYRLMSQRFEDRGQAADLCQSLKNAGRGCLVLAR